MKKILHNSYIKIAYSLTIFIIAIIFFIVFLYSGKMTSFKKIIFEHVPLPAFTVNDRIIFSNRVNIDDINKEIEDGKFVSIFDKLQLNFDKELYKAATAYYSDKNLKVNRSYIYEFIELAKYYNSQKTHHFETYAKVQAIFEKIKNGEDLSQLAKQYSENVNTSRIGGDTGYVTIGELLPEIQKEVEKLPLNKPTLIVSASGLHIIEITDKDDNGGKIMMREIFMNIKGFDTWIKNESRAEIRVFLPKF